MLNLYYHSVVYHLYTKENKALIINFFIIIKYKAKIHLKVYLKLIIFKIQTIDIFDILSSIELSTCLTVACFTSLFMTTTSCHFVVPKRLLSAAIFLQHQRVVVYRIEAPLFRSRPKEPPRLVCATRVKHH